MAMRTPTVRRGSWLLFALLLASLVALPGAQCGHGNNRELPGSQLFASPQTEPITISADGAWLYVAHTVAGTVLAIETATGNITTVRVGLEPVSVELRPDGSELWVANHVSDTVTVIDADDQSATFLEVQGTIQDLGTDLVTNFDEPADIAFASDAKAYVSLSSTNRIAVVDVASRTVTGHIDISAQEPRAIAVRNGLLFVAAFESGNQTEISVCAQLFGTGGVGDQCSLGLLDLVTFVTEPNVPGATKNIVVDTDVPDRDLFVFDATNEAPVDVATGLGTLHYGIAVDSSGRAFLTHTEARNAENGDHGDNLVDLDNRIFLNRITRLTCTAGGCGSASIFDLEPAPPAAIPAGDELATPYGVRISDDDATVVATAAGTSRLFTLDASSGAVLGILDLGSGPAFGQQIPRGVALVSDGTTGAPQTAYVLNSMDSSVTVVDVTNPALPSQTNQWSFAAADPTADDVRRGRIAFMNAFASDSGTFSCESCHPDGNTDQLLWRIGGACFFGACSGDDEPRTTMPVRGLRNTLPLHWDGTLGDPIGGPDGSTSSSGSNPADCTDEASCFRHLVDASLSGVMCDQSAGCPSGGPLTSQERDDMAAFLASVSYPPARGRPVDDVVSAQAVDGFADFFVDQGGQADPNTCADSDAGCHELPLGTSTNSSTLEAFDAPTMRGMTDRWLQFSMGMSNAEEILVFNNSPINLLGIGTSPGLEPSIQWDPAGKGFDEITTFGAAFAVFDPVYNVRPIDMFQMFEEASTGLSGAVGRQVQLNAATTTGGALAATDALLTALEQADAEGRVNLRAYGTRNGSATDLEYTAQAALYQSGLGTLDHATLLAEAQAGTLNVTATGFLRGGMSADGSRQPLLATDGTGDGATGDPPLPHYPAGTPSDPPAITVDGIDVSETASIFVDGVPAAGTLTCSAGATSGVCNAGDVSIDLDVLPSNGLHLLQVQNPKGLQSNELPLCVGNASGCD